MISAIHILWLCTNSNICSYAICTKKSRSQEFVSVKYRLLAFFRLLEFMRIIFATTQKDINLLADCESQPLQIITHYKCARLSKNLNFVPKFSHQNHGHGMPWPYIVHCIIAICRDTASRVRYTKNLFLQIAVGYHSPTDCQRQPLHIILHYALRISHYPKSTAHINS